MWQACALSLGVLGCVRLLTAASPPVFIQDGQSVLIGQALGLGLRFESGAVSILGSAQLKLDFPGARPVAPVGTRPAIGKVTRFRANEPAVHVNAFEAVEYPELYPGITLRFMLDGGALKSEFEVRPHADASVIRVRYTGAKRPTLLDGSLVIDAGPMELKERPPVVYDWVRFAKSWFPRLTGFMMTVRWDSTWAPMIRPERSS